MGSSGDNSRRTIVRFMNRKFLKKALLNRSKLQKIPSTSPNYNENLTLRNSKTAFLCRKLKPHRKNVYKRWYGKYLQPRYSKRKSTQDLPSK